MIRNICRITAVILITFIFALNIFAQETPKDMTKVKVVILPFLSFAPFFIADKEGFFKEQGIAPEFVRFKRGDFAISALIREKIDVLAGGISAALINAIKNGNIKITAGKGRASSNCSYQSVLTTKELSEAGDLFVSDKWKERRVFIRSPGSFSSYFFAKTLEGFGLNIKEAKVVKISDAIIGEAFLNNALDIAVTGEPWVTRIKTENKDITEAVKIQEILPDFQFAAVLYGKRLLYQDTDLGKRFMAAYLKGVRQYNKGKTKRNLEIVAEATKLDKDILKKACWPIVNNNGKINVDSIIEFQNWAVKEGLIEPPIIEKDKFWNPNFVNYADKILSK